MTRDDLRLLRALVQERFDAAEAVGDQPATVRLGSLLAALETAQRARPDSVEMVLAWPDELETVH